MDSYKIYLITNRLDGKIYIGKTKKSLEERWEGHIRRARTKDWWFGRAINKYGREAFHIVEIDETPDFDTANKLEMMYIQLMESYKPEFGYNGTFGGDGVRPTIESRKKLSLALKGKFVGSKHPMYGRKHTNRQREANIISKTGNQFRRHKEYTTEQILDLYDYGYGVRAIARMFGVDKGSIIWRLKPLRKLRSHSEATKLGMKEVGFNVSL